MVEVELGFWSVHETCSVLGVENEETICGIQVWTYELL